MLLDTYLNKVLFIDGAGGTGKTLLLNAITAYFRSKKLIVLCTVTTGVAALLHDGGVTAHFKFKLPLDTTVSTAFWNITGNSQFFYKYYVKYQFKAPCMRVSDGYLPKNKIGGLGAKPPTRRSLVIYKASAIHTFY